jgi:extradiol dioxygenase
MDAVGRAWDLLQDRDIPYLQSLGRHCNDQMLSFYAISPSGLAIEYGYGARTIDDATWTAVQYDTGSVWGHRPPPGAGPMVR